jgi:hypothetical protein
MIIALLGGVGIGFVWGWLIGSVVGNTSQPRYSYSWIGVATLFLSLVILLLAAWPASVLFLGATGITLSLHLAWRRLLMGRFKAMT